MKTNGHENINLARYAMPVDKQILPNTDWLVTALVDHKKNVSTGRCL